VRTKYAYVSNDIRRSILIADRQNSFYDVQDTIERTLQQHRKYYAASRTYSSSSNL